VTCSPTLAPYCSVSPARIWVETEHAIAFAHGPTTDGHMLIVPRKHVGTVYELRFEDACSPA
jgi:diadenosine tetraphosphate (Ap4A) HIT family hydrolase